jgi:hypothetical protein
MLRLSDSFYVLPSLRLFGRLICDVSVDVESDFTVWGVRTHIPCKSLHLMVIKRTMLV